MKRLLLLLTAVCLYGEEEDATDLIPIHGTSHILSLEGEEFPYTALTGTLPVPCDDQEAEIFFVAYFLESEEERPITFLFPGGPGGSSAAMIMCSIGPRRILMPHEGKKNLPPYTLIDNPETILPWTDLVFVDPVGSGYSTSDTNEEITSLFSVEGDLEALGHFVRSFISYFERWDSPKYLAGISYGATRACGLSRDLLYHDLSLHGIILLGAATDYSTLISQQNHFLPDCLLIPTFAATAWHHKRTMQDLPLSDVIEYARRFALEDYAPAMLLPTRLSPFEEEAFYQKLANLIGLPFATVKKYQGRFDEDLYTTEFFGSERKILGGLDTRFVGDLSSYGKPHHQDDPSYREIQGIYAAFNRYLQQELDLSKPFDPYITFSATAHHSWNFFTFDSIHMPDLFQRVRKTLVCNPQMKVFVGSGYYDCRTPFAAIEYDIDHLSLPASYRKNFQFEYYEAGHGFIFDGPSLKKLKKDLVAFYEKEL